MEEKPTEQARFYFTDLGEVFLTDSKHKILGCRYAEHVDSLHYLEPTDPLDAPPRYSSLAYSPGYRVVPTFHPVCKVHPKDLNPEIERTKPLCKRWDWPKEYNGTYPVVSKVQLLDATEYVQYLRDFNDGRLRESTKIGTARKKLEELERKRRFNSELDYLISRSNGLKPEEEREEAEPQTLEEKVGENIIWQLKEGDQFRALMGYLNEHKLADDWTVKDICCTAVQLALNGRKVERYAQAVLSELIAKKDWVDQHPAEVRFISVEQARVIEKARNLSAQQQSKVTGWDWLWRFFGF